MASDLRYYDKWRIAAYREAGKLQIAKVNESFMWVGDISKPATTTILLFGLVGNAQAQPALMARRDDINQHGFDFWTSARSMICYFL